MKNYFLLLFIGITLVSCSNDDDNSLDTNTRIIGNWNWIVSHGGFGNWTHTPESTGNTLRLEISSTTFKRYFNGELVYETTYTIELREPDNFSGEREMIVDENGESNNIITFNGDNLVISGDCVDCFGSEFVRE